MGDDGEVAHGGSVSLAEPKLGVGECGVECNIGVALGQRDVRTIFDVIAQEASEHSSVEAIMQLCHRFVAQVTHQQRKQSAGARKTLDAAEGDR